VGPLVGGVMNERTTTIRARGPYTPPVPQQVQAAGEVGAESKTVQTSALITVPYHLVSGASTNATLVIGATAWVQSIWATNVNAAIRFLKFYDTAKPPVPGTDLPVWVSGIPGNAAGAGGTLSLPTGMTFFNGIGIAIVAGAADLDATAVALNEIVVSFSYQYRTDARAAL
jgi:hypothetical protein